MSEKLEHPTESNVARRGWPWFTIGLLLFIAAPVAYGVQFAVLRDLSMPWYLPILATVGVLLMLVSVVQRRGIVRIAVFAVLAILCGMTWYFVLVESKTPEYAGPVEEGEKLPAFTAQLADGTTFSNADLAGGIPSALVFFRGRW